MSIKNKSFNKYLMVPDPYTKRIFLTIPAPINNAVKMCYIVIVISCYCKYGKVHIIMVS